MSAAELTSSPDSGITTDSWADERRLRLRLMLWGVRGDFTAAAAETAEDAAAAESASALRCATRFCMSARVMPVTPLVAREMPLVLLFAGDAAGAAAARESAATAAAEEAAAATDSRSVGGDEARRSRRRRVGDGGMNVACSCAVSSSASASASSSLGGMVQLSLSGSAGSADIDDAAAACCCIRCLALLFAEEARCIAGGAAEEWRAGCADFRAAGRTEAPEPHQRRVRFAVWHLAAATAPHSCCSVPLDQTMLRTAQRITATAGGGAQRNAGSLAGIATTLACTAATATSLAAASSAPCAFLHARASAAMRHTPTHASWFHGARRAGAQSSDKEEDSARSTARTSGSTARPSFRERDAAAESDGAASKDARLFAAAQGQWFEVEFVYGGPSRSWAIVHKPAGLGVQAGPRAHTDSLEKRLRVGYGCREIYFPHRIDKHTCGLLVVAFNRGASKALGQSLEAGQWEKKYRAICVVPPPVDMEQEEKKDTERTAATETAEGSAQVAASPPLLTFTSKFPAHSYPASALVSSYLQGSLWSAAPLPSAPRPPDATDLAGSRTPIGVHLRPQAILRSYLVRRGLPAYSALDPQHEWAKWNRAIIPAPANRAKSGASSISKQDEFASRIGSFTAASPSKDGLAYNASPALDRRRLHPFVPETMLYESVPFKPMNSAAKPARKGSAEPSTEQVGIDEDDVDEAEITASLAPSSSDRADVPKKSVTEFTLLSSNPASRLALYDVSLHTGRSHQIRIHCADAGMPILNDPYYNAYAIYEWMRRAARAKMEDQVAAHMRKQAASRRGSKEITTLDDIVRATDAALHAGTAASEFGCTIFPPPALPPLQPPSFSLRAGPLPARLKPSGTSVTIAKGTMPKLHAERERGNNQTRPEMLDEVGRAERAAKKAARSKYDNRRPRAPTAARSFFTRSAGLSFHARYPPRAAEHSASSFADGSKSSTTAGKTEKKDARFKRKPGFAPSKSGQSSAPEPDEPLPVGRSSVGQRTAAPSAARPLVHEHEEYDDDSERRVLKSKPRPAAAAGSQAQGAAASQQSTQQQQPQQRSSHSSNSSSSSIPNSSSRSSTSSTSTADSTARSPRKPKKNAEPPPRPAFEFDEGQQFEHHMQYQGRRKPLKARPAAASQAAPDAASLKSAHIKYTSRHDAPARPSWLPEHVPYRLVAPNAQVDANWQSVLSKYGVGSAAAATEGAETPAASTAGAAVPARKYKDPNRGAGAVGWLVKDDPSLSAASTAGSSSAGADLAALSTPTPVSAVTAPASDNHWFASQVAQPAHEMALHAYYLRFPHPSQPGEVITCVQPMRRQWEKIMEADRARTLKRDEKEEEEED